MEGTEDQLTAQLINPSLKDGFVFSVRRPCFTDEFVSCNDGGVDTASGGAE